MAMWMSSQDSAVTTNSDYQIDKIVSASTCPVHQREECEGCDTFLKN